MFDTTDGRELSLAPTVNEPCAGPSCLQLGLGLGIWALSFAAELAIRFSDGRFNEPFLLSCMVALCVVGIAVLRARRSIGQPLADQTV